MKKSKRVIGLILCTVLILSLAACGATTGSDDKESGDKTATVYSAWVFNSLNPFNTGALSDAYVFNQVYETFTIRNIEGELEPQLAKDWEISDDGLTYTINLVEDATFHNGENLKASDVVFTYEYAKDFAPKASYYSMVKNVEAKSDYQVVFTLDTPTPLFLDFCQQIPIVNEKFVKENDNDITNVACGTGPYKVESFDPATRTTLVANEEYRLEPAKVKKVNIDFVADSSSAVVMLESGDLSFMSVPPANIEPFIDNPDYNSEEVFTFYTAQIVMNVEKEPFDNKLVRQAFSYAADKESILTTAAEGYAEIARIIGDDKNTFGVDFSDSTDISYNPEKAKELLAEAGYPDGLDLGKEFDIKFNIIPGTHHEKSAQIFQKNLADIGVTVELQNDQAADENAEAGTFGMITQGNTYRKDFSYSFSNYGTDGIGGNNFSRMSDEWVDDMFVKGASEKDQNKRLEIYKELVAYIVDYCPSIPLWNRKEVFVWEKDLNASAFPSSMYPFYCYTWSWAE